MTNLETTIRNFGWISPIAGGHLRPPRPVRAAAETAAAAKVLRE
jgi:hypothetical protein